MRTPYIPKRSRVPKGEKPVEAVVEDDGYVMPDTMPEGATPDPWASIDESVFEVPDMDHPEHRPGNSVNKHEFVLGDPIGALEV